MSERWLRLEHKDEFGADPALAEALRAVDPATDDPNYWFRFRAWVLESAGPELARRRLLHDLTVGDVLTAWARTLVPTALMAAAVAGVLLVRQPVAPTPTPLSMEEVLTSGLEDAEPFQDAEATQAVTFASEQF